MVHREGKLESGENAEERDPSAFVKKLLHDSGLDEPFTNPELEGKKGVSPAEVADQLGIYPELPPESGEGEERGR